MPSTYIPVKLRRKQQTSKDIIPSALIIPMYRIRKPKEDAGWIF